jgi:hypothetical protein
LIFLLFTTSYSCPTKEINYSFNPELAVTRSKHELILLSHKLNVKDILKEFSTCTKILRKDMVKS